MRNRSNRESMGNPEIISEEESSEMSREDSNYFEESRKATRKSLHFTNNFPNSHGFRGSFIGSADVGQQIVIKSPEKGTIFCENIDFLPFRTDFLDKSCGQPENSAESAE